MIRVKVQLVSVYRRHGSAGPKPTKVRSTAAAKFKALTNKAGAIKGNSESDNDSSPAQGQKINQGPKPYGGHNGNTQVKLLREVQVDTDDQLVSITNYITNVTSNFEGRTSFNLKQAKHQYRLAKDEIVQSIVTKYGTNLDEKATTEMLTLLHAKGFTYTQHQIVITIASDDKIEGGRLNKDDNLYYVTIKSKMVYTKGKTLLSENEIKILEDLDDSSIELRTTTLSRVPCVLIFDPKGQRYYISYEGPGNIVAGKVLDSY